MLNPTLGALLPNGSNGATDTVPQATDTARWLAIAGIAGCVIDIEPLAATLDSAAQLVTVIIVLILVRAHLRV